MVSDPSGLKHHGYGPADAGIKPRKDFRNFMVFRTALFRRVEGETLPLSVVEKETVRTADRQFSAVYARHFTAGSLSSGGCLFYIFWK